MNDETKKFFTKVVDRDATLRHGVVQEVVKTFIDKKKGEDGIHCRVSKKMIAEHLLQNPLTKSFFDSSIRRAGEFVGSLVYYGWIPELVIDSTGMNHRDRHLSREGIPTERRREVSVSDTAFARHRKDADKFKREAEKAWDEHLRSLREDEPVSRAA